MDQRIGRTDTLFFAGFSGLCAGIVFSAFSNLSSVMLSAVAFCAIALFVWAAQGTRFKLTCLAASIFLFAALFGMGRMEYSKPDSAQFAASIGKTITVTGTVDGEPNMKPGSQSFVLDTDSGVSISVSSNPFENISYGDRVSVRGELDAPANFTTSQGTQFDYVSYLYKDDILYVMRKADVTVVSHGHGSWILAQLMRFEDAILASYKKQLSTREANLLGGLVLGTKSSIDEGFRASLVATGTIHIIALSGFNVTIVANTLRAGIAEIPALGPTFGTAAGIVGIMLFVAMTGLQSSAIRAGIMAVIALIARSNGRQYAAFRALMFAAGVMILYDPKYLIYDVSFQLSFLATLGILFLTPLLSDALHKVPEKVLYAIPLRETIATTLGAQISVLPFILYKMGTLSLIALPANMLVLPAIPVSMGLGAIVGFLGMLSTALSFPFAYATHLLLVYLIWIITFLAHVPFASIVISRFPLWLCIALYVLMVWFVLASPRAKAKEDAKK